MPLEPPIPVPDYLSTYTWRSARPADAPAIQTMLAAGVEIDKPRSPPTEERIRHLYALLGERIEQDTLLALTDEGAVAAEAFIFFPPAGEEHLALVDGNVHVHHRGRGLGSFILNWMDARVRQEFSELDDGLPRLVRTSCAAHHGSRVALFEQHGFEAMRYSYTMQRSLQQPLPEIPLPPGLNLLPWSPALDPTVMHAFNDAFQGQWGLPKMDQELWQEFFTGVPQFRADLTCLAMVPHSPLLSTHSLNQPFGTVAGFCINWVVESGQAPIDRGLGWIEAIGVVPAWRGLGLASALLVHTLNLFKSQGLAQAALDVDTQNPTGALRLYQKLGFEAVREEIHFVKRLS